MPLASRAEHEKDGIHGFAIIDTGPMASQWMGFARWEQRLNPCPQGIRDTPVTAALCVVIRHPGCS
jgi:hypothetical protein